MPLSAAFLRKLRSRGQGLKLEVEDLLQVAAQGEPADADTLEELVPAGVPRIEILVPWRLAACAFLRGGFEGLERHIDQTSDLGYACGILAEVPTVASVSSLLRLGARFPSSPHEVASALNLILSFKGAPDLPPELEGEVRIFLHGAVERADADPERATAILGLRGVGDASSLALLDGQAPFESPWHEVLAVTRRAIRRRQARRVGGSRSR